MRFLFFSLRDFKIDVGETVRIYGLLNSLAASGHEVVFISNATRFEMFHPSIKQIYIGYKFQEKRKLQALLALLPYQFVWSQFRSLFSKIEVALENAEAGNEPVYFFDYLDNSIGYLLKRKGIISKYINDVHGIATLEFQSHIDNSKNIFRRISNRLKYYMADRLDKKVFELADGFIYGSENMRKYFDQRYRLTGKGACIIPYLLGEDAVRRKVNYELKDRILEEWAITPDQFIILFVGTYKATAGVDDLIAAFDRLHRENSNCKLFLIGGGPSKTKCVKLAHESNSNSAIIFIDSIPYEQLFTYQNLANVIVCPDKDNPYSHFVVHVKYFDALISGRLVINGGFESVKEINRNECLSLDFEPSNIEDLYRKLKHCSESYDSLKEKYSNVKEYTAANLTYSSYIDTLTKSFQFDSSKNKVF